MRKAILWFLGCLEKFLELTLGDLISFAIAVPTAPIWLAWRYLYRKWRDFHAGRTFQYRPDERVAFGLFKDYRGSLCSVKNARRRMIAIDVPGRLLILYEGDIDRLARLLTLFREKGTILEAEEVRSDA